MMCKVMGIVNVTPDSFSDGGQFFRPEEAIRRAKNLIADGADIIDLGGESTRPGATPIGWEEEWSRIEPVLAGLMSSVSRLKSFKISVDTYHPETAERAIEAGANIINCVYAEPIPEMVKLLEGNAVELVVPWRLKGEAPSSALEGDGTSAFLTSGEDAASPLRGRLYLDPMIGFGTTREEDVALWLVVVTTVIAGNPKAVTVIDWLFVAGCSELHPPVSETTPPPIAASSTGFTASQIMRPRVFQSIFNFIFVSFRLAIKTFREVSLWTSLSPRRRRATRRS